MESREHARLAVAIIYARVSTQGQEDRAESSHQQVRRAREWIRKRGYQHEAHRVYVDILSGGHELRRIDFFRMLEFVESGAMDGGVVVAWDPNRIGRNDIDQAYFMRACRDHNVRIELASTGARFSFRDPIGKATYGHMAVSAELYRSLGCIQMMRGKEELHRAGRWASGRAPYGYEITGTQADKDLAPTEQASVVREIFEAYATGDGTKKIAAALNARGVPAPGKHRPKRGQQPPASRWNAITVGNILANRIYLGYLYFQGQEVRGRHPPIVDQGLWDRVDQRREAMRARYPGRPRRAKTPVPKGPVDERPATGRIGELERLASLYERGHLTEDEFAAAKRGLLAQTD